MLLILLLIIGLLIGGMRGGFLHSTRPITLNDAGQYVTDPSQVSLVLNTPCHNKNYIAFGDNVFKKGYPDRIAWNFADNLYHFYEGDFQLTFDEQKSTGLYKFKADKMNTKNLLSEFPDTIVHMERKIKAVIQQYNNRMIDNNFVIRE